MACRHHCVENVLGQYYSLQTMHDTLGPATGRIGAHKSLFRFVNVETEGTQMRTAYSYQLAHYHKHNLGCLRTIYEVVLKVTKPISSNQNAFLYILYIYRLTVHK